jgi:membrane-associated phospholipid phosphatase
MPAPMRRRLRVIETRILPRGWRDVLRQLLLGVGAYGLYELVRGLVSGFNGEVYKPFGDATNIINLERALHVFVEPSIQAWTSSMHWLMDFADWSYLNAHYFVTIGALVFIYLRRNDSFYFVRNMFMIAMAIALVGYALYPTAPPRLMPEWGFTDSIAQFLGVAHVEDGPGKAFLNFYAAVPSIHVCFAVMIGWPMAKLVRRWPAKVAWILYPFWITFVVVATGNHYLTDVFLGAATAGASALFAGRLLARARPDVWAFGQATA